MTLSSPTGKVHAKTYFIGLVIWLLAGGFFLYEFFIRAFMGSVADPLQSALSLSPEAFGLIASAYYLAYSPMQIPVGILMDRFGVRILLTCGALLCALGTLLFSEAHTFHEAWIARFLMGLGSSVGFISLLTISMSWFPQRFSGFFAGMTQVLGTIGPILSGAPLAYWLLVTDNNWRLILQYVGGIGILLTLLLLFIVRNKPEASLANSLEAPAKTALMQKIKMLLKRKEARRVAFYAFCIYGAVPLIGESFGAPYLEAHGFSLTQATAMVASLWLGLGIGSPLAGLLSDAIGRRKIILTICALLGFISVYLFATSTSHSMSYFSTLLFLVGFATGGQTLSFALMAENVPRTIKATAMGFNNFAVMLGGMFSQLVAGIILNHFWTGSMQNITALPVYAYQTALLLGCGFFALAFLSCFLLKETYARHVYL